MVHPGAGNKHNTIVNYLVYKYKKNLSNLGGSDRPCIVHRLDKNTSGLLVIAKNNFSHSHLGNQFKNHTIIERTYLALILGVMRPLQGRIETLISRDKRNRQIMSVSQNKGKKAITNYKTLKVFNKKNLPKISFVEFKLETGRTHQIRLHVKYKGCSVLGDEQYGNKKIRLKPPENFEQIFQKLNGQVLHAKTLGFEHPRNGEKVNFDCDLPYNFSEILNFLGSKS